MTNTMLTLFDSERLAEHTASGHWRDETIYALAAARAASTPDAFAVRDRRRRLTYRELVSAADCFAADLTRRGVRPGERIAVWLRSSVDTAIAVLAASRNGFVVCTSLHRDHTVAEVVDLIRRMRAAAVLAAPGFGADADRHDIFAALQPLEFVRHVYRVDPAAELFPWQMPKKGPDIVNPVSTNPNRVMYLPFTSGTTGVPKGVLHSDNTLLATARCLVADWHLGESQVVYTMSPLSHNLGLGAFITSIVAGAELVVHDTARGESVLDRLIDTGATFLFGVPTHAIDLLAELRQRGASQLGLVKAFRISGAASPPEVIEALMRYGVTPQSGYGMTETCSHQYTLPTDDPKMIAETCGRSCDGYEIRIFRQDNPDVEAPAGEIGQIGGRGASLMLGYFGDQESTEKSFNANGWFMTGDLGWMDENGYLRITGRKKDVIIRGGHNIYPSKIENLAAGHPRIEIAAAFPVADARLGERVCLAVLPRDGAEIDPEEILRFLDQAGLSRYDMPEHMLVLEDMPLTASGKVMKRDLIDSVAEGRLKPVPVRFTPQQRAAS